MSKLNKIDAAIRDYYQKKNLPVSSDLITAILYSVDSGGKRIRPLIFLDLLEGFGLELTPSHFDVAASLEMIHTGSLIHDDLPAMDDDDYRRGRLTNHKKFDEATAILAGDSLFLDPFDLLAQTELSAEIRVQLIQALSHSSGTFGMVGGQMLGKTPGKDVVAGKSTYPALLGLEKSHAILEESLDKAEAIFQNLADTQGFKKDSIIEIIERLRLHA